MSTEIKSLTDEQLVHKILSSERDLVRARFDLAGNRLDNTASLSVIRKDIARLKTEARAREAAAKATKGSLLSKYAKSFAKGSSGSSASVAEKGGFLKGIVDKLTAE